MQINQSIKLVYDIAPIESAKNIKIIVDENITYDENTKTITAIKEGIAKIMITVYDMTLSEITVNINSTN